MHTAAYVTVDVFTTTRFAGNPLAVFPNARGLSSGDMQKIATEFNYSEITFVLPPESPDNSARIRIFTPTAEIPFAGHPNVGTAFVLGQTDSLFGRPVGDRLRFEEDAGLVEVELLREAGTVTGATIRAPRPLSVGAAVSAELVARCASLDAAAIRTTTHQPLFVSVGLPFAIAEVDGLATLGAAMPNLAVFTEAARRHQQHETDFSLFIYVRSPERPWQIRARMFAPLDNVSEDPATGSASAALSAYLVSLGAEADATVDVTIDQGVEMGRPSRIELRVLMSAGIVTDVRISGRCVGVMQGRIAV